MSLKLYNSLTRSKDPFAPLDPDRVRMYVCGPTVYDRAHIGNARAVVVFDQLYRLLRHTYGAEHVRYVRNITDVDDKIIAAARESGEPIAELTRRTTAEFHADMAALNTLPPDVEPRATEHIAQMIAMIERLIVTDHAYVADGHVLFAVASDPEYGVLSRRSRAEMVAGARVEVAPYKRDPGDFVLWKPSDADQPGWDSPWGRGRPGWHIECSAMSEAHLGESFDIHGGGLDLIFPHHENEIAQSTCAHEGKPFASFWVHNGFLTVNGAKMAKSLGNFVTVRDLLAQGVPGEAIRLALLSTHYRDPLDWTEDKLRQAKQDLFRFYNALPPGPANPSELTAVQVPASVCKALEDDLNTPLAIRRLHEITTEVNRAGGNSERAGKQAELRAGGALLGLLQHEREVWLRGEARGLNAGVVEKLAFADHTTAEVVNPGIDSKVAARIKARRARNFAEADRIRAELAEQGIVLEDKPDGTTTWRRA